jgi:hypothetical protein
MLLQKIRNAMIKNKWILALMLCVCGVGVQAQSNSPLDSALKITLVSLSGVVQQPAADLAKRFGYGGSVRLDVQRLLPNNIIYGLSGGVLAGNQIKENDIANNLTTTAGGIIDENGNFAVLELQQRGVVALATVGKIYVLKNLSPNPNSGLLVQGGAGFLQHKINIYSSGGYVPQLSGIYKKGYDRLTNGVALQQLVAYHYLSNDRRKNFYVGIEIIEAMTKNRRSYNFNQMRQDTKQRLDIMVGVRAGWVLPLYKKIEDEYIVY